MTKLFLCKFCKENSGVYWATIMAVHDRVETPACPEGITLQYTHGYHLGAMVLFSVTGKVQQPFFYGLRLDKGKEESMLIYIFCLLLS
jgi:hypothetical protein